MKLLALISVGLVATYYYRNIKTKPNSTKKEEKILENTNTN